MFEGLRRAPSFVLCITELRFLFQNNILIYKTQLVKSNLLGCLFSYVWEAFFYFLNGSVLNLLLVISLLKVVVESLFLPFESSFWFLQTLRLFW